MCSYEEEMEIHNHFPFRFFEEIDGLKANEHNSPGQRPGLLLSFSSFAPKGQKH